MNLEIAANSLSKWHDWLSIVRQAQALNTSISSPVHSRDRVLASEKDLDRLVAVVVTLLAAELVDLGEPTLTLVPAEYTALAALY